MHIFFSGVGGTAIGPLALIAHQAGCQVSGSDKQDSSYFQHIARKKIGKFKVGQTTEWIESIHTEKPIDWLVCSSAIEKEHTDTHPEVQFAKAHKIKISKRDEFINALLNQSGQKMVAIAGTHGKSTTTAMAIWAMKQLNIPISYSVGAKIPFGEMGEFNKEANYFVYEADEYDRNFLQFKPSVSIITGIDYDHPDIYPTRESYYQAFVDFICQSNEVFAHAEDLEKIGLAGDGANIHEGNFSLKGRVNRQNASLVAEAITKFFAKDTPKTTIINILNSFPGVSRRFEEIAPNIYSDYAHTPEKIRGALQLAKEVTSKDVVVVYEGLHNTRQHFIKTDLKHLFDDIAHLYVVPSYLAREDTTLQMLSPQDIINLTSKPQQATASTLSQSLLAKIKAHAADGDIVLCLSAGGGGSLDEWLRAQL
jgi:UDP-N-acetylmuramate--alanine ligase